MIHAIITFLFCTLVFLLKLPAMFYVLPMAFYMGRELAQAEYRIIKDKYHNHRDDMPWYAPFMPSAWTMKSMLDWILPAIVTIGFLNV